MSPGGEYPGTSRHQRLLHAICTLYAGDLRILAALLFGSLARGTWDEWSDIDLDIVLADGIRVRTPDEAEKLCAALLPLGERAAVIAPKRADEVDIVLVSLAQISIRYHSLAATSPNIVASMRLLCGSINPEAICAAGQANTSPPADSATMLLGRCVRALVEADVALQRRRVWFAIEHLAAVRDTLIALFGMAHDAPRPLHAFQHAAPSEAQEALSALVPHPTLMSSHQSLLRALDTLEHRLGLFAGDQVRLSDEQRAVLWAIRSRQQQEPHE